MKWIKWLLLIVVLAGVAAAVVFAAMPKPEPVDVATVRRGTLTVEVEGDGRTRVQDRYVVAAPLYGNLARVELAAGDDVEPEAVLARVTPLAPPLLDTRSKTELEARVRAADAARKQAKSAIGRAKSAAEFAKRELERAEQLAGTGALSEQELDAARENARSAANAHESTIFGERVARYQAEVARAARGRADRSASPDGGGEGEAMEIRSPTAGRVLRVLRESEGVVNPGTPILELGDPSALEIVVDVLTEDAVEIAVGDEVRIERWGGDEPLQGQVRRVEPSAFTKISALGVEEQRVNVLIDLADPPESVASVGDGYRVEVAITVWSADDALIVPVSALHRRAQQWAAFVVDAESVREVDVTIGRRSGFDVQVLDGLDEDDVVVVHPSDSVRDGASVTPR